ncbi:MAG TPA: DUF3108 domain-containing protein [Candidatus Limnocylindrales bacterium]|nr:DUF3108 domain-containing protein [Candidatus Limnocylindrales bacterium]
MNSVKGFRARASQFAAVLLATCICLPAAFGQHSDPHKSSKSKTAAKEPVKKDVPMPFRIGETLNYEVAWATFSTAASVQLSVPERRDVLGWGTWHFRATAHTQSPVRTLFTIDDQFDSYTDAATLESRQFEMYLDELGRKQNQTFHFVAEGQPAPGGVPVVIVLPGTRDPLGALYALRSVDWPHTQELRVPVYDGRNLYELHARMEAASDPVEIAAGKFSAVKISLRLFQNNKEVSGTKFTAWLANDAARTPVLLEGDLPLGTIHVELKSLPK